MRSVNLVYMFVLLGMLPIFSIWKLHSEKENVHDLRSNYTQTLEMAKKLNSLKKEYKDNRRLQSELQRVIAQNQELQVKKKGDITVLTSQNINYMKLNNVVSKLFNDSFNLQKIEIKRVDDIHAQLYVEIKW
ncbi:hypothetical protein [Sulfurimonas sp. HSL-1716]|uniref:hypothetical protein n=1 Tax=Hydrocurvibacter sulfurireducens TaxID=3131937 RepID=UPI0031FA2B6D